MCTLLWYLLLPPIVFVAFLVIFYLFYAFAGTLCAKPTRPTFGYKYDTYMCGEEFEGGKIRYMFNIYHLAFFYTIVDIAALILLTSIVRYNLYIPILFCVILIICVLMMVTSKMIVEYREL